LFVVQNKYKYFANIENEKGRAGFHDCAMRTVWRVKEGRGMDGVRELSLRGSLRSQAHSAPWNARFRSIFVDRGARQAMPAQQ